MYNVTPLGDRVKILTDNDWEQIWGIACAMVMSNERLDMQQAEAYAMLSVIELREQGGRLTIQ